MCAHALETGGAHSRHCVAHSPYDSLTWHAFTSTHCSWMVEYVLSGCPRVVCRTQTATRSRSSHCIVSCATLTLLRGAHCLRIALLSRHVLARNFTTPATCIATHSTLFAHHTALASWCLAFMFHHECATAADFLGAPASTLHTIPDHEKKFQLQPSCCSELR
jgi:hypothetical protein